MLTVNDVRELPISTPHEANRYHDKVEVEKHTLMMMANTIESYKRALQNCLKFTEVLQDECHFLQQEEAQVVAKHASNLVGEVYRAFSYPVMSCVGKTEKGDSFYKAKVLIKFDTSG